MFRLNGNCLQGHYSANFSYNQLQNEFKKCTELTTYVMHRNGNFKLISNFSNRG